MANKWQDSQSSTEDEAGKNSKSGPKFNYRDYGYNMYPERKGDEYKPSWTGMFFRGEGREPYDRARCERNVYSCVRNSPLVKLLIGALNASGCKVDIRRHFACEVCDALVSGGYDPILNQVVVCQNMTRKQGIVQGVLIHELVHMFDYCENKLDFKNLDHLACTEVRAANLAHCSYLSAMMQGDASPFNIKKMHQECVKTKALSSVLAARNVTTEQAMAAIERVFDKCYNDLEPVGRRIRRNSEDMQKAFVEGAFYGYVQ